MFTWLTPIKSVMTQALLPPAFPGAAKPNRPKGFSNLETPLEPKWGTQTQLPKGLLKTHPRETKYRYTVHLLEHDYPAEKSAFSFWKSLSCWLSCCFVAVVEIRPVKGQDLESEASQGYTRLLKQTNKQTDKTKKSKKTGRQVTCSNAHKLL